MNGRDRQTVFWIRYIRWCRGVSLVTTWPEYRRLLLKQACWLIEHGRDRNGTIAAAHERLSNAELTDLDEPVRYVQGRLF